MRNKIFLMGTLLFSSVSFASGKIVATPRYYEFGKVGGSLGLAIYERITQGVAFNSWVGIGTRPFDSKGTEYWMSSSIGIDLIQGVWTYGIGLQPQFSLPNGGQEDSNVFIKFSRQLW